MIRKITDYMHGVQLEMKKVTWLSKEEMLGSTLIVGVFSILIAIFLFFVDFGLSEFISRSLAGEEGLEPSTPGFGGRCSTN